MLGWKPPEVRSSSTSVLSFRIEGEGIVASQISVAEAKQILGNAVFTPEISRTQAYNKENLRKKR